MSSNFTGITFANQNATPSDDGIIRRAMLGDGILTGCALSYTGSTLTMGAGQLMICGRQIRHPSVQNWPIVDATSGFARVVITIDLTKTSTKETFEQVSDRVEYASTENGFPALVQNDINASGTMYEVVAAVVSLAAGGISGITYRIPESGSGVGSSKSSIIVTAPTGSAVYIENQDGKRKDTGEKDGVWTFKGCDIGTWTVHASRGTDSATAAVVIQEEGQLFRYYVNIGYQLYASDFEVYLDEQCTTPAVLGTDYEVVYDDDTPIDPADYATAENWKIRNLVTLYCVPLEDGEIDIFCVGGGESGGKGTNLYGAGGGSGRTNTGKNIAIIANTVYQIVVGSSAGIGEIAGTSSAFGVSAEGGGPSDTGFNGGPGGTGGNGGGGSTVTTRPQDGQDGYSQSGHSGGKGQGTTTREFGEPTGKLYAYGGIVTSNPTTPEDNTGSGGDGGKGKSSQGSAGIVVFRNARGTVETEVAA